MDKAYGQIYASVDNLTEALVGKTITGIDKAKQTIRCSDGTEVRFEEAGGCCSWFESKLKKGVLTENAITSVTIDDAKDAKTSWDAYEGRNQHYILHILATDTEVCALEVKGDLGTGYYTQSVSMSLSI